MAYKRVNSFSFSEKGIHPSQNYIYYMQYTNIKSCLVTGIRPKFAVEGEPSVPAPANDSFAVDIAWQDGDTVHRDTKWHNSSRKPAYEQGSYVKLGSYKGSDNQEYSDILYFA